MNSLLSLLRQKKPIVGRCLAALALLCLLVSGTAVHAGEETAPALTLSDAVERSLAKHPSLLAQAYRYQAAGEQVNQARIRTGREIQLEVEDALGSGLYEGTDNAQATLSISWALEGRYVSRRIEAATAAQSLAALEQDRQRYDVAARTAQAFLTALAFQERLALAQRARDNAERALTDIRRRSRAGGSSSVDVLRAEVALQRRLLDVEDLEHELAVARQQLAAQWGEPATGAFHLQGALDTEQTLVSLEQLRARIKGSPRVRQFLTRARISESEMAVAKSEALARWRFSAGLRRYEATDDYGVVAGVAVPLGNRSRNRARVSELAAEQAWNEALAVTEANDLEVRLFELYQELMHSRHQATSLVEQIIPRLEQATNAANDAYNLGRFTYLEWQSVQQELLDARLELINARLLSHANLTELERLTGLSLSADQKEHNE